MTLPVYLDNNATTPVDARVLDAMLPWLNEHFGNASSKHAYGAGPAGALQRSRQQVAALLGATPGEIVFTGGGSEANNQAIKGVVFPALGRNPHVITSAVEHPATLNTLAYLRIRFGVDVTVLPVDEFGRLNPADVLAAIRPQTVLVTVMHANNEVGTLQDLGAIAAHTRDAGVLLHVDAAQSAGKYPLDLQALGIDLLTVVGHKLYAPKGVGVLYVRRGTKLDALVHGASQECGRRAGTENVAGAVGLGLACELAADEQQHEVPRLRRLRDRLHETLVRAIPAACLNGHPSVRLCNTLNISLPGVFAASVLAETPEVAASTGSACHSDDPSPSPVLTAMGLTAERSLGAIRLSLGRFTTEQDVVAGATALIAGYRRAAGLPA